MIHRIHKIPGFVRPRSWPGTAEDGRGTVLRPHPYRPNRMPDHPLYICPARCSRNGQEGDTDPLQLEHGVPGIGDIFPS